MPDVCCSCGNWPIYNNFMVKWTPSDIVWKTWSMHTEVVLSKSQGFIDPFSHFKPRRSDGNQLVLLPLFITAGIGNLFFCETSGIKESLKKYLPCKIYALTSQSATWWSFASGSIRWTKGTNFPGKWALGIDAEHTGSAANIILLPPPPLLFVVASQSGGWFHSQLCMRIFAIFLLQLVSITALFLNRHNCVRIFWSLSNRT